MNNWKPKGIKAHERIMLADLDGRLRLLRGSISSEIRVLAQAGQVSSLLLHDLIPGLKAVRYTLWSVSRDIHDILQLERQP